MKQMLNLAGFILALSLVGAAPAQAQLMTTRSPSHAPSLGATIRGASPTVFSISSSGGVTRVSGDAIRMSTASVRTPTVTVTCGPNPLAALCGLRYIRVTVSPASSQGPARITRFRIANLRGTGYLGGAPSEGATMTFDLLPLGLFRDAEFDLGMDVRLDPNAPSGEHPFDYMITVQLL